LKVDLTVPDEAREQIVREIHSDSSPVGIDAKKTHMLILYKLTEISRRLEKLESTLNERE
jgi:hypothetical protein